MINDAPQAFRVRENPPKFCTMKFSHNSVRTPQNFPRLSIPMRSFVHRRLRSLLCTHWILIPCSGILQPYSHPSSKIVHNHVTESYPSEAGSTPDSGAISAVTMCAENQDPLSGRSQPRSSDITSLCLYSGIATQLTLTFGLRQLPVEGQS